MAKLKLDPNPTFDAIVMIPVPGSDPAPVRFTFKHRSRSAVLSWFEASRDADDAQSVMDVASGWDLDDDFTEANVKRLVDNYTGASAAVLSAYLDELRGARAKN